MQSAKEIAQERLREQERVRELEPEFQVSEGPVACPLHEWRPKLRPGQPLPPQSLCPGCAIDAEAARNTYRPLVEVEHPLSIRDRGLVHDKYTYGRHEPDPRPGSSAEEQALEAIDDLRSEEQERNRRQGLGVRGKQHLVAIRGREGLRDYVIEGGRMLGRVNWA
jgi:hypothetical protein